MRVWRMIRHGLAGLTMVMLLVAAGLVKDGWAEAAADQRESRQASDEAAPRKGEGDEGGEGVGGVGGESEGGEGVVHVGKLVYDHGKTGTCFADGFLAEVARRTDIRVHRSFEQVNLDSRQIFDLPFVVMSGAQRFSLSESERANLKRYLKRGGFVLASAGCSHRGWARDLRALINGLFASTSLEPLKLTHPLFNQIFEIKSIKLRRAGAQKAIQGLRLHDRLAVVFSPMGLNDTSNAGEGCCCCGGNELLNAKAVNTNVLVYALTH